MTTNKTTEGGLQYLRDVAKARTQGEWFVSQEGPTQVMMYKDIQDSFNCSVKNAKFIALAANTYDALLDCVEAMSIYKEGTPEKSFKNWDNVLAALAALESAVKATRGGE